MNTPAASPTERNQRRLRDAAERLQNGRAQVSDGKLTLKSLAEEAGVPRPYLYRSEYKAIAEDFEFQVRRIQLRGETTDPRSAEIDTLRADLNLARSKAKKHRADLVAARIDIKSAASRIVFLSEQNRILREELNAARRITSIQDPKASTEGRGSHA